MTARRRKTAPNYQVFVSLSLINCTEGGKERGGERGRGREREGEKERE